MGKQHHYRTTIQWTGNRGEGTTGYKSYDRAHTLRVENKEEIKCSSDPAFLGDASRYNPEDLLLASLSSCHMLWYLHLCADNGVIVTAYEDAANGIMEENESGGRFVEVVLNPSVIVKDIYMIKKAEELHIQAHENCFIANSVNFPVTHKILVSCG